MGLSVCLLIFDYFHFDRTSNCDDTGNESFFYFQIQAVYVLLQGLQKL